jgi:hypothetical protein
MRIRNRRILTAGAIAVAVLFGTTATAQESSYTRGSVLQVTGIDVEDGQFENYVDYLAKTWRKIQELGVNEGIIVSYRVWQVNDARAGEPDLYLAVEFKDYQTTAQTEAFNKKVQAMLAADPHQLDKASAERGVMRTLAGQMEMQELKLK